MLYGKKKKSDYNQQIQSALNRRQELETCGSYVSQTCIPNDVGVGQPIECKEWFWPAQFHTRMVESLLSVITQGELVFINQGQIIHVFQVGFPE